MDGTSYFRACPYVVHIYVCVCIYTSVYVPYVNNPGVHGRFYGLDEGRIGKQATEVARLVNDEENNCRFEVQRKEHWIHTRHTLSIAVRERLLGLFCD